MKYINQLEHRDIPYEHNFRPRRSAGGKSGMWLRACWRSELPVHEVDALLCRPMNLQTA